MRRKLNKTRKLAGLLVGSMLTMNTYNLTSAQENTTMSVAMEGQTELEATQEIATYNETSTEQVTEALVTSEAQTEQPTETLTTSEAPIEQPTETPTTSEAQTEQSTEAPTTSEAPTEAPTTSEQPTEALTTSEAPTTTEQSTEEPPTTEAPPEASIQIPEGEPNMAGYSGGGLDVGGGSAGSGEEKKKVDPMVPRIIVTQCDYDKNALAGKEFTANITIFNTNDKLSVENMIVTFDTGGTATIENGSNTVYLQKLAAQGSYTAQLKLKVPEDSKSMNADLTVSFKYEYMKNTDRTEVESSAKISLPVQSVDKFTTGNIQTSDEVQLGEEFTASMTYVNKGTSAIRNLEVYIESDMKSSETYKYIGNVEAGTSGTVDFFVTPESAGDQKVKITLKYQDAEGNEKTIEKEGSFQVSEATDEMQLDESSMSEENDNMSQQISSKSTEKKPVMAATGLGGAVVIGIAAFLSFWKKKKHSEDNEEL